MTLDASGNLLVGTTTAAFDTGSGLRIQRENASATIRLVQNGSGASSFAAAIASARDGLITSAALRIVIMQVPSQSQYRVHFH